MYFDDSIFDLNCQLEETRTCFIKGEHQEINPWQLKKSKNEELSQSYKRLGMIQKATRVSQCSSYLEFRRYVEDNSLKLQTANFCKVRLCPMCTWRRSLKVYGQMSKILEHVPVGHEFLFLTLTIKNCHGKDLSSTLDLMYHSFKKFSELKVIKKTFVGWFRALEVTYNKRTGEFHPHFHVVLCANSSYFKKNYIKHKEFISIWQQCLGVDYAPTVNIKKFTGDKKAVAESCKYTVKDNDYIVESHSLTDKMVSILDGSLANRRLIAFGGLLKKIHKELNLSDAENGDLVHIDGEEANAGEYIIEKYGWHVGLKNYYILKD